MLTIHRIKKPHPFSASKKPSFEKLAILKEEAEYHKGEVWAEPGPEKGVTFYVSISKCLQRSQ
jgi:light-regulated signal transduction histidine kinase (bacteriophytochrome)